MELRTRIRPLPRSAARMAALAALLATAFAGATASTADAAKKRPSTVPVITAVSPKDVAVGETLTIRGRNFVRGRNKNTVVFKRDGARAVFVKAPIGTAKLLRLTVPSSLQEFFTLRDGSPVPTRFRLRILGKRFGKSFTSNKLSPIVSAPRPPESQTPPKAQPDGDCDGDGRLNRDESDDDGDGLTDAVEISLGLDTCKPDTDGDGVLDKWEFDCDRDGILNRDESDDDDDLLSDTLETQISTNPCAADSDGDGVQDGFEYKSAIDLNDDNFQQPNLEVFYPVKLPYPNPNFKDASVDYDGDSLTLAEEQSLWTYTWNVTHTDARTLFPLSYSDGLQFSRSVAVAGGPGNHRQPTLAANNYDKHIAFVNWANAHGYGQVWLHDPWHHISANDFDSFNLFDMNRDGAVSLSELQYYDFEPSTAPGYGWLSDNERDEDADGLTNFDEAHSRLTQWYWSTCYANEKPYYIPYAGTSLVDADTDGDGVLDGADDQDHDDIPNVMEMSRIAASGDDDRDAGRTCKIDPDKAALASADHKRWHIADYGRVNPFNPCLPDYHSTTCAMYFNSETGAPYDDSVDWFSIQ